MTPESPTRNFSAADGTLDLDDIQAGVLMPRPTPYAGSYQIVRIDDPHAGRELLRRLIPYVDSVASFHSQKPVALGVALSFEGLRALRVPEASLDSFPAEFQQLWRPALAIWGRWGRARRSIGRDHSARQMSILCFSGLRRTTPT